MHCRLVSRAVRDYTELTRRLADLIVGYGANVQPGQLVGVTSYIGKEELTREIARAAYERGAQLRRRSLLGSVGQAPAAPPRRSGDVRVHPAVDARPAAPPLGRACRPDLAERPAGSSTRSMACRPIAPASTLSPTCRRWARSSVSARRTGASRRRRRGSGRPLSTRTPSPTTRTPGSGTRSRTSAASTPMIPPLPGTTRFADDRGGRSQAHRPGDSTRSDCTVPGPTSRLGSSPRHVGRPAASRRSTGSATSRTSRARRRSRHPIRSGSTAT